MRSERIGARVRFPVDSEANYNSGEDYVVEFLGYRFSFNASDFEQRVTAAAVKLGLLAGNELDDDETADLVELVERDAIEEPRSALGRYLVRHWERGLPRRRRGARLLAARSSCSAAPGSTTA